MKFQKAEVDLSTGIIKIWFRTLNPYGFKIKPLVEAWLADPKQTEFTDVTLVNFINAQLPDCAMTEQQFAEQDPKKKTFLN